MRFTWGLWPVWSRNNGEYQEITVNSDQKQALNQGITLCFSQKGDYSLFSSPEQEYPTSGQEYPRPYWFYRVWAQFSTVISVFSAQNSENKQELTPPTIGDLPGFYHFPPIPDILEIKLIIPAFGTFPTVLRTLITHGPWPPDSSILD